MNFRIEVNVLFRFIHIIERSSRISYTNNRYIFLNERMFWILARMNSVDDILAVVTLTDLEKKIEDHEKKRRIEEKEKTDPETEITISMGTDLHAPVASLQSTHNELPHAGIKEISQEHVTR